MVPVVAVEYLTVDQEMEYLVKEIMVVMAEDMVLEVAAAVVAQDLLEEMDQIVVVAKEDLVLHLIRLGD